MYIITKDSAEAIDTMGGLIVHQQRYRPSDENVDIKISAHDELLGCPSSGPLKIERLERQI